MGAVGAAGTAAARAGDCWGLRPPRIGFDIGFQNKSDGLQRMQDKDMPSQIKNTRHVSQTKQSIRRPINVHSELLATATHESKTQRHVSHTKQSTRPPPKFLSSFSSWLTTQHETHVSTKTIVLFLTETHMTNFPRNMSCTPNNRHGRPLRLLSSFLADNTTSHTNQLFFFSMKHTRHSRAHMSRTPNNRHGRPPNVSPLSLLG